MLSEFDQELQNQDAPAPDAAAPPKQQSMLARMITGVLKAPPGTSDRTVYLEKQVLAGFPQMVAAPFAMYGAPKLLKDVTGLDPAKSDYADYIPGGADTANNIAGNIVDTVNTGFGIDNAKGVVENVANLSSAIVPAKLISLASKVPEGMSVLKGMAHVADAVVNPGVQGDYTKGKAAANFGIPFVGQQAIENAAQPVSGPNHQDTIFDAVTPSADAAGVGTVMPQDDFSSELQNQVPASDFDAELIHQDYQQSQEHDKWQKRILGVGAVMATVLGARHILKDTEDAITRKSMPASLSDAAPNENVTSVGSGIKGAVFDEQAPAIDILKKDAGTDAADTYANQTTMSNATGVASQASETFSTGRFPIMVKQGDITPIRATPLQDVLHVYEQGDPVMKRQVNDTLQAMDELDQMKLAGAKLTDPSIYPGRSFKQLKNVVTQNMKDPGIKQLVQLAQDQPKANLRFMQQAGLISADTAKQWMDNHPHYMPRNIIEQQRLSDLILAPNAKGDPLDFINVDGFSKGQRNVDIEGRGSEFEGTFMPPMNVLGNDQRRVIRAAQMNNTRRLFFQNLTDENGAYKIKGIREVSKDGNNVIKYYDNGQARYWKVKDPYIYSALKHGNMSRSLDSFQKTMNTIRQVNQFTSTGPVANPVFQLVSGQTWNPVWAMVVKPKDLTLGGVTAPFAGAFGAYKAMKGHIAARRAENFRNELMTRQVFNKANLNLPDERVQQLLDSVTKQYAESPVSLYRLMGGSGGRVWNDYENLAGLNLVDPVARKKWVEAIKGSIDEDFKPDYYDQDLVGRRSTLGYYLHGILDSLHNGVQYQMMDINKPKGLKIADDAPILEKYITDLSRLSAETKNIFNTSRTGTSTGKLGKAMSYFTTSVPYGNVMLQQFYRLGQELKRDPAGTTKALLGVGTAGAAAAYMNSRQSQAYKDWYWHELTPEQRASSLWIPNPTSDDPHDAYKLPLEPTTASFFLLGQNLFDSIFAVSSDLDPASVKALDTYFNYEDPTGMTPMDRRLDDAQAASARLVGFGVPPLAQALAPAFGKKFGAGGGLTDVQGQRVKDYNDFYGTNMPTRYVDGIVPAKTEAAMNGLFGAAFTMQMVDMLEGAKMYLTNKPGGYGGAVAEAAKTYKLNLVGPSKAPTKSYTIEARELKDYETALDTINAKYGDVVKQGFSRQQHGIPLPGQPNVPQYDDPSQQIMIENIRPQMQKLREIFRDQPEGLADLMKQKDDVLSNPRMKLEDRKATENVINKKIQTLETQYLQSIQLMEKNVANQLQTKEFDVRDWVDNGFKAPPAEQGQ